MSGIFFTTRIVFSSKYMLLQQDLSSVFTEPQGWLRLEGTLEFLEGRGARVCVLFLSLLKKNVIKSWYLCVLHSAICLGLQKSSFFFYELVALYTTRPSNFSYQISCHKVVVCHIVL